MRGRFTFAAAMCLVLVAGCSSPVAGAGVRDSDRTSPAAQSSGSAPSAPGSEQASARSHHTSPSSQQTPPPDVTGSIQEPSGSSTSAIRPMPPITTTSPRSAGSGSSHPDTASSGNAGGSASSGSQAGPASSAEQTTQQPPSSSSHTGSTGPSAQQDTTAPTGTVRPGGPSPAGEFDGATPVDPAQFHGLVTDIGFQSPSGNIHCGIQDGTVVCQIEKFTYTPPAHDCGDSGWGFNFRLASKSAELFCAGDVESGGPTLEYGRELVIKDVRCVSREDGVICQNTATGYGFRLARAEYVFFGPNDVATTVGAGGTSAAPRIPRALVGEWDGHGRSVTITAGGTGTLTYRAYQYCSDDPAPPCDKVQGNQIISGGHIAFHLLAPKGSAAATGTVTKSNDPKTPVGTVVTATVTGYNLELSFWPDVPFCAANTPSAQWNCGA